MPDDKVMATLLAVVRQKTPAQESIDEDCPLASLGLDSLDLAQVVAELEMETGLDPFAATAISGIRTVADLCAAYRTTVAS